MLKHIESCKAHIACSIISIKLEMDHLARRVTDCGIVSQKLIVKRSEIESFIHSYRGRGLRAHRPMLFLHAHLLDLKITQQTYLFSDARLLHEAFQYMLPCLQGAGTFELYYYSVDIEGYRRAVQCKTAKIETLTRRIAILEKFLKVPPLAGPPDDLAGLLLFPTSSTASLFRRISRDVRSLTFDFVLKELRNLTDDPAEFDLIADLAFDFAWDDLEYPFIPDSRESLPSFMDVRVALFDPPLLDDRFLRMHVRELAGSDWPFAGVLPLLEELTFMHNPMEMARLFARAMDEAARAAPADAELEMGFDAIFPILLVCVLACGLTRDARLFAYVGTIAFAHPHDNLVQLGATYAQAVLMHIRELDEAELLARTRELDAEDRRK
jgi:hypothetical protein